MNKRAQAGLEYLMTYGWALVLIATLVGAIVFIVGTPKETSFTSSDPTKLMVAGGSTAGNESEVILKNITGGKIKIKQIDVSCVATGCQINGENFTPNEQLSTAIEIPAGGQIHLTGINHTGTESISIEYMDFAGLEQNTSIGANSPVTPPTGTCGDGTCDPGENCESCSADCACAACFLCEGDSCSPQTGTEAEATAWGCGPPIAWGDEECRYCDNGECGLYDDGQKHGCENYCEACDDGRCRDACPTQNLTDWQDCSWNLDPHWTCDGGYGYIYDQYTFNPYADIWQSIGSLQAGQTYKLFFEIVDLDFEDEDARFYPILGGTEGSDITEEGYRTQYITAGSSDNFIIFRAESEDVDRVDIEEISLKGPCPYC